MLLKQEGVPVCDVDVSTRESDGRVVVVLTVTRLIEVSVHPLRGSGS